MRCMYPDCERDDAELIYADWGLVGCPEHREAMVDDLLVAHNDYEIMEIIEKKYFKTNEREKE